MGTKMDNTSYINDLRLTSDHSRNGRRPTRLRSVVIADASANTRIHVFEPDKGDILHEFEDARFSYTNNDKACVLTTQKLVQNPTHVTHDLRRRVYLALLGRLISGNMLERTHSRQFVRFAEGRYP